MAIRRRLLKCSRNITRKFVNWRKNMSLFCRMKLHSGNEFKKISKRSRWSTRPPSNKSNRRPKMKSSRWRRRISRKSCRWLIRGWKLNLRYPCTRRRYQLSKWRPRSWRISRRNSRSSESNWRSKTRNWRRQSMSKRSRLMRGIRL